LDVGLVGFGLGVGLALAHGIHLRRADGNARAPVVCGACFLISTAEQPSTAFGSSTALLTIVHGALVGLLLGTSGVDGNLNGVVVTHVPECASFGIVSGSGPRSDRRPLITTRIRTTSRTNPRFVMERERAVGVQVVNSTQVTTIAVPDQVNPNPAASDTITDSLSATIAVGAIDSEHQGGSRAIQ
jgi:hypothetical protein